ncbi:hypothetical protein PCL_12682 [Purpureocillium lilacinum]|uniref:RNase H type-1 domain-containing protein n=1 Tax=Purpureocillium lilacinum TaxID=33203 RepID=A0A2U3DPB1_PURLI|nr:hypothetical protein PCL_12682 [Purpureocillium lilacinum]
MRFAARLKAPDEAHPLAKRTLQLKPPTIHRSIKLNYHMPREGFRTRLRRTDQLLPRSKRPQLLSRQFDERATALQAASKGKSAEDFRVRLRSIPHETFIVHSDGSLSTEKTTGYGYVIHRCGLTLTSGSGRLGLAEVFDAEARGALEWLRAELCLASSLHVGVCLDNLAAATCLRGMPANPSQEVFLEFQALATTHGATEIRWIPGHTNIAGNEQADALAKAATSLPEPADALPTLAHLRRTARQQPRDAFEAWWDASAPDQHKPLHLKPTTGCPPEPELPRPPASPAARGKVSSRRLRRLPREIQPRRCAAIMLMWPTKRANPSLLLPKDPAATSDEAGTLTDCGSQSRNRQRLRQAEGVPPPFARPECGTWMPRLDDPLTGTEHELERLSADEMLDGVGVEPPAPGPCGRECSGPAGDAAAMHEIITLQLGNLSNYTATHFWNAQVSYFTYGDQQQSPVNHDVHWRAGVGHDGAETFLPRTVIYDLKGGFGALRKINPLYDATLESGRPTVHKQDVVSPSAYQASLDAGEQQPPRPTGSSVRYWSDFSRVYFHPRSLVQLYNFELDSTIRPFERFGIGTELFSSLDKEHDVVDRDWRPFAEECDLMQGIQVFTTLDDAWGGFASSYLEALRDEYPKTCIWVWGLRTPLAGVAREKRQLRLVNTAQTLGQACAQASMVVPLSLPDGQLPSGVSLDPTSPWQVSGLLATAADSAGLPSRLAGQRATLLSDMAESLNTTRRQTVAAAAMDVGSHALDLGRKSLDSEMFDLGRPGRNDRCREKPGRVFSQLSAYRGIAKPEEAEGKGDEEQRHSRPVVGNPVIRRHTSTLQFPLLDSYPHIFRDIPAGETSAPVRTVLSTTTSMTPRMRNLRSQVSRSVALEERETLSSGLADIADAYQDGWSSGSDEDDDDL